MPFTGKATYSAGATLPELVEDVADIIGIVSPYETPLLDHLGDAQRPAVSTIHEWLEDTLLPNRGQINDATYTDPMADTTFGVDDEDIFKVGDQIQVEGSREVMLVTTVNTGLGSITVVRGYGGTTAENLADNQVLHILGNAALEGADRPTSRFTNRTRQRNFTQIFTASVEVSGSQQAARQHAIADEADYQKQQRLRELVRDLENCVINGTSPSADPEGSSTVRRTMDGIIRRVSTNIFQPGVGEIPPGEGTNSDLLTEEILNAALRIAWESSSGTIDTIVVNGFQKRRINSMLFPNRSYSADDDRLREFVSVYESDFGVCRVILSRWVPADTVLLLDRSRLAVMPLGGRSFHYKPLSSTGDSEVGQLIGEYTLEMRNENAHAVIRALGTTSS
ncbi:MAG: DUF5309 family protein [Phycisphaerales bacterium]|nr:DUF5309 family protein [Phycisphaerales bacterium]